MMNKTYLFLSNCNYLHIYLAYNLKQSVNYFTTENFPSYEGPVQDDVRLFDAVGKPLDMRSLEYFQFDMLSLGTVTYYYIAAP